MLLQVADLQVNLKQEQIIVEEKKAKTGALIETIGQEKAVVDDAVEAGREDEEAAAKLQVGLRVMTSCCGFCCSGPWFSCYTSPDDGYTDRFVCRSSRYFDLVCSCMTGRAMHFTVLSVYKHTFHHYCIVRCCTKLCLCSLR